MNRDRAIGTLQELAWVAWTLLAAWTALPTGHDASAAWLMALGLFAAVNTTVTIARRSRRHRPDWAGRRSHAPKRKPLHH